MLEPIHKRLIAFLRWSEKYTKTDMVYLFRGGFWLSLAQLAASVSGFLLTAILANILAPELLGEYRFLISGFTLLSLLALPGMRTALRESTPKGFRGNLSHAFRAMRSWGSLGALAAIGGSLYYFGNDNPGLGIGFLVIAAVVPFYNASTGYLEYLTALKEFKKTTLYTFVGRIAVLLGTALAAFIFPTYAWAIFGAFILGTLVPNMIFHFKTVLEYEQPDDEYDPGITRYAGHITAMTVLGVVAGQLDKMFVWSFVGAEALAFFYIAYTVPLAVSQYMIIVPTLAFAKFGEADPRTIRRTLMPKILKYLLAIAAGTVIYIVAAPYIFAFVFPQYTDAVIYSQILALVPLFAAFMPIKTYLTSLKATKDLYILSIIPPGLRILVAVVLIVPFGIWGAVWSLLTEAVVRTILLLIFFFRTPK